MFRFLRECPDRHPHIWHGYLIAMVLWDMFVLMVQAWNRDVQGMLFTCSFLAFGLWTIHHPFGDDNDDQNEDDDDPDDWPDGDAVDRWLRSRTKHPV